MTDRKTWVGIRIKDLIQHLGRAISDDSPMYTGINQIETMSEELSVRAKEFKDLVLAGKKGGDKASEPKRFKTVNKVVKYGNHCYNSMDSEACYFWEFNPSRCTLFGDAGKAASYSLKVCNKVYGRDYEGDA